MASYWGEVEIIQNWQSIEGNYTNVTANYYACADSYAGWSNYTTYPFLGLYHGADKTEESQTLVSFDFRKSKKILIGSITKNIPHNTDGTMSVSASFTWDSDHSMVGTLTGSASKVLTTIPRASSINATDANIGSPSTVMINSASDSFTHTVTYSFNGLSDTIATKTKEKTIPFDIPTSFFEKMPETQDGVVSLTCYTYSGDILVGTKPGSLNVGVPSSGNYDARPLIDSATARDINPNTLALTGNDPTRLVTYKSNVKISVEGRCIYHGAFKVLRSSQTQIPATTSSKDGTTTVSGSITHNACDKTSFLVFLGDKRGLYKEQPLNEANGDFTVVPYIPLTMSVEAKRVGPTSNSAKLSFTGNFYNGYYDEAKSNFNDLTIKWRYKLRDGGSWITTGADDTTNGWHNLTLNKDFKYNQNENTYSSIDNVIIEDLFDYQENYTIEIMYQDRLSSYTTPQPILAGVPNHDYGKDANGKNYFWINGDLYANGEAVAIKPVIRACYINDNITNTYTEASYIPFTTKRYDNSDGKIVFGDNGLITIKHDGYIKVSFNIWVHGSSDSRPWVMFKNYTTNTYYIDAINDSTSGYVNFSISDCIIPVTSGQKFGLYVSINAGDGFGINNGSGRGNSYMTIELI